MRRNDFVTHIKSLRQRGQDVPVTLLKQFMKSYIIHLSSGDVEQEDVLVRLPCNLLDAFKFLKGKVLSFC